MFVKQLHLSTPGLVKNKSAAQDAGADPFGEAPPLGKIHPFSKIAVTNKADLMLLKN